MHVMIINSPSFKGNSYIKLLLSLLFTLLLLLYIIIISSSSINIIIIIISFIKVFAGVLFVHQPGANHAPKASVTQVNHSVQ